MEVEENVELKVDMNNLKLNIIKFNDKLVNKLKLASNDLFQRKSDSDQKWQNLSESYISEYSSKDCKFIQYAHGYFLRLYEVKNSLIKQVKERWATFKICENILDIKGKVIF